MEPERLFESRSDKPTEPGLKTGFGPAYAFFEDLNGLSRDYLREWKFYASGGWIYKVYDKKKALFYLIPMKDAIGISLTVRETERVELLNDPAFAALHEDLQSAKKYPEGYALRYTVRKKAEFRPVRAIIERIVALRT